MVGERKNYFHSLITYKNKGWLVYPSDDVLICTITETILKQTLINTSLKELNKNAVITQFLDKRVFLSLRDHFLETLSYDNHLVLLINAVVLKYIDIRKTKITKRFSTPLF